MSEFTAHIIEADSVFFEGTLESLIIPTENGMYGVLAHHQNVFMAVVPGIIKYRVPGEKDYREASVSNGFMRIYNNDVMLMIEAAEHPEEIDEARVRAHEERAREKLLSQQNAFEYNLAEARLRRSIARMSLKERNLF